MSGNAETDSAERWRIYGTNISAGAVHKKPPVKLQIWDIKMLEKEMECVWLKGREPEGKSGWMKTNELLKER